ncbi:MAG TPA: FAD-binding protein, partial [Vicinamibacterales bacterium]|nr:FAD-binding protein [Vicinamibacterales bacterium]
HLGIDVIRERLWQIREIGIDLAGVDVVEEPIPILPGMHYIMGGIKTDIWGRTNVPGLYAAGETACVSVHGANRLGANSLLDTVIFGKRSGMDAAERARSENPRMPDERWADNVQKRISTILAKPATEDRVAHVRMEMGRTMNEKVQVFREEEQLKSALDDVKALKKRYEGVGVESKGKVFNTDLLFYIELGYMLDVAEMVCASAIERKESRGAHFRTDFNKRDDENWLHHITCSYDGSKLVLGKAPVTITRWTPEERKY